MPPEPKTSSLAPQNAHGGMFVWTLIVGLSFPAVGLLSEGLPPLFLTAIRFAIAAIAFAPLIWRAPDRWPSLSGFFLYAIMGLCLAGFFGAMFSAAHQVSALSMATLYVSVPLLAYMFGRMIGVERADLALLGSLFLGAAGALALAWAGSERVSQGMAFGLAEGLFFLGCAASALYPVLSKWGLKRGWLSDSAAIRTFWSLIAGGLLIGLLGLIFEPVHSLGRITATDLLLVAYLGIFSSGVTFWLLQRGTGVLSPGTVTAYTYLIPFVSMIVLFVSDPETIGWHWLPGSIAVILAILLLLRRSTRQLHPAAAPQTAIDPSARTGV
ncbi:DMT family transporter [Nitratireductor rhodophyticola]|uniref:DMT family transporter n=1 Tax=Nitratireductor rhodophyticola TaxID=2854036 RepID=UPI002AC9EA14|nr:DMT family transporter [Nitratireductor rhodophyticola]WPZ15141.1 DMT family transporter [Nitratireductor rhodophyticola]